MGTQPLHLYTLPSPPSTALASSPANPKSPSGRHVPNPELKRLKRLPSKRRTLSCLPCRRHKLKCDRLVPCHSCSRYRREEQCRQNPPPSSVMGSSSASVQAGTTTSIAPVADSYANGVATVPSNAYTHHNLGGGGVGIRMAPAPGTVVSQASTAPGVLKSSELLGAGTSELANGQPPQQYPSLTQHTAGTSVVPSAFPFLTSAGQAPIRQAEVASYWKVQLTSLLPKKQQCDWLISYYIDHLSWVHHAVHAPSFLKEYDRFWSIAVQDVDLVWLSLVYAMISCSAIYLPLDVAQTVGFDRHSIRNNAHVWYSSARQALHAGGFESKPCIRQLETFLVLQLYWLATKNAEVMNSCLGQAVRNAQALGLDKDGTGQNLLETEIRRRVWWELFNCDTFQSMCLGRRPLIHKSGTKVPLPIHCNDIDLTESSVTVKPFEEPTDMSGNIVRVSVFMVFRKLFDNDLEDNLCYEHVNLVDTEIQSVMANFPWYYRLDTRREVSPEQEFISWQHHLLHSCICMQRIRMHRPFISTRTGNSWEVCAKAANEVLAVYQRLRNRHGDQFYKTQKFFAQAYQIYSAAVALAAFLLVERSFPGENIRKDIEMVIFDLGGTESNMPTASDGRKILLRMLDMHDRGLREPLEPESLVSEIYAVFGGENTTRKYLKRCDIGYVLNGDPGTAAVSQQPQAPPPPQQQQQQYQRTQYDQPNPSDPNQLQLPSTHPHLPSQPLNHTPTFITSSSSSPYNPLQQPIPITISGTGIGNSNISSGHSPTPMLGGTQAEYFDPSPSTGTPYSGQYDFGFDVVDEGQLHFLLPPNYG